ncbi:hypothetical protein OSB04_013153 [Centaurea solstitialis]|uniref:Uncharacterized protein n=1 Tax=Centaurea solstitialis TaxID=347529 RepID=A0AA38TCQ1_9ASTR|nr:hypothetical protein OSB04_013153 [Centaurea solstitialis]
MNERERERERSSEGVAEFGGRRRVWPGLEVAGGCSRIWRSPGVVWTELWPVMWPVPEMWPVAGDVAGDWRRSSVAKRERYEIYKRERFLSMLPTKWLLQCWSFCKSWLSLINSTKFKAMHLHNFNQLNSCHLVRRRGRRIV